MKASNTLTVFKVWLCGLNVIELVNVFCQSVTFFQAMFIIISLAELFRGLGQLVNLMYGCNILRQWSSHYHSMTLIFRAPISGDFFTKVFHNWGTNVYVNMQELEISQHTEQFAFGWVTCLVNSVITDFPVAILHTREMKVVSVILGCSLLIMQ